MECYWQRAQSPPYMHEACKRTWPGSPGSLQDTEPSLPGFPKKRQCKLPEEQVSRCMDCKLKEGFQVSSRCRCKSVACVEFCHVKPDGPRLRYT